MWLSLRGGRCGQERVDGVTEQAEQEFLCARLDPSLGQSALGARLAEKEVEGFGSCHVALAHEHRRTERPTSQTLEQARVELGVGAGRGHASRRGSPSTVTGVGLYSLCLAPDDAFHERTAVGSARKEEGCTGAQRVHRSPNKRGRGRRHCNVNQDAAERLPKRLPLKRRRGDGVAR